MLCDTIYSDKGTPVVFVFQYEKMDCRIRHGRFCCVWWFIKIFFTVGEVVAEGNWPVGGLKERRETTKVRFVSVPAMYQMLETNESWRLTQGAGLVLTHKKNGG